MGLRGELYWWCKIEEVAFTTSQRPISIGLAMGKVQSCRQLGWWRPLHSFCSVLKYSRDQHPASGLFPAAVRCCIQAPSWSLPVKSAQPRATWFLRPCGYGERTCECTAQVQVKTRGVGGREPICSPDIILVCTWKKTSFLNKPSNFPNIHRLLIGL